MAHTDSEPGSAKKALPGGLAAVLLVNLVVVKNLESLPVRLIGFALTIALVLVVVGVLKSRARQADDDRATSN